VVGFYDDLADELIVYTRYSAWLNTVPQPKRRKRGNDDDGPKPVSRREARGDTEIEMPPITAPHLFERLMEIGPTDTAGMDREPLRPATIAAWADGLGIEVAPWEVRLLRRLSAEYLAMAREAAEVDCPSPWVETGNEHRLQINRKLAEMFGS
jgi:hypothetical protein